MVEAKKVDEDLEYRGDLTPFFYQNKKSIF